MMLAIIMVAAITVSIIVYLVALFKEMIIARRRSKHG